MFFETLERIKSIGQRHAGKTYTPRRFTHLLRMQFRDPGLRFTTEFSHDIEPGNWTIRGEYRPYDDEEGLPCVHLTFVYPKREKRCVINRHLWDEVAFIVADIIVHEYIHRYYCRRRGYKFGPGYRQRGLGNYSESWRDYLGCEDEILAHAFNVASEMAVYHRPIKKTRIYRLYQRHFRQDPKILNRLTKLACKYLKQLELR